jgi:hypothetical protein
MKLSEALTKEALMSSKRKRTTHRQVTNNRATATRGVVPVNEAADQDPEPGTIHAGVNALRLSLGVLAQKVDVLEAKIGVGTPPTGKPDSGPSRCAIAAELEAFERTLAAIDGRLRVVVEAI